MIIIISVIIIIIITEKLMFHCVTCTAISESVRAPLYK